MEKSKSAIYIYIYRNRKRKQISNILFFYFMSKKRKIFGPPQHIKNDMLSIHRVSDITVFVLIVAKFYFLTRDSSSCISEKRRKPCKV